MSVSPDLHRYSHEAMTTVFEVMVAHDREDYAAGAAMTVFREIDRLEGLLSRHDACSDISQVNRLKPGDSVRVAPDVFECLAIASWVCAETRGAFDPTVGPLLKPAGCSPVPALTSSLQHRLSRVGMNRLQLYGDVYGVGVRQGSGGAPDDGVEIDLGGIGKGFALDKAADILEEWSIGDYLLSAGSSTVLAAGTGPSGQPWVVGVGGEWGKAAGVESVAISNEALSGSGTEVKNEHIIVPSTGFPAQGHLAAWSICPSATLADALSTAFMVMPTHQVGAFCSRHRETGAFVVNAEGRLICFGERAKRAACSTSSS